MSAPSRGPATFAPSAGSTAESRPGAAARFADLFTRHPVTVVVVLALLALVLRVGFMLLMRTLNAPPQDDGMDYDALARSLLAGRGFSLDGVPVVNRAPAYPFLLAAIYSVTGPNPAAARLVGALLAASLVPLLYVIGSQFWGRSVGLWAAGLFAVYPFSIFWGQYIITENLLVALFVMLGVLLVRPWEAGVGRMLGAGVVAGISMLTRPTALPVVLLLLLWLAFAGGDARRKAAWVGLLAAGICLALAPWVVRNYSTYGQFIPFTSGYGSSAGGYVFWISNNSQTATPGEKWGRYVPAESLPEYGEYSRLPPDPALLDREGYRYGLGYLASHPASVPLLLLGKFLRFWNVFPGASLLTKATGATVLLLLPFFLLGLRSSLRGLSAGGLPLAFIVGTLVVALIYWADTRTRVPADPYILLVCALGITEAARRFGRGRTRRHA